MKHINRLRLITVFTALLLCGITHGETLRLNLKKGDQFLMHGRFNITTSIIAPDKNMEMHVKFAPDILYRIKEQTPQGYAMDVSFERLLMNAATPLKDKDFCIDTDAIAFSDSLCTTTGDADLKKQLGIMLKMMMGKSLSLDVARNGKILKTGNIAEAMQPALNYMTRQLAKMKLPADSLEKIKAKQKNNLKQADFASGFEKTFIELPEKPLNQGDTWQTFTPLQGDTLHKMTNTYKLLAINPDEYLIESVSSLPEMPSSGAGGFLAMLFKLEIGDNKAIYHLDRKTGWIKSVNGSMTISMTFNNNSTDKKQTEGKSTKMAIRTDYTVSL